MPLDLRWVIIDFETASACNLKRAGAWRYAEDPTTEVLCMAYSVGGEAPKTWRPGQDDSEIVALASNSNVTFIAHNVAFEKAVWRKIMGLLYGWPDIPNSRWHDTQAACAMRVLPLALERAAVALNLPHQKDMEGSRLVKSLSKLRKDGTYDRSEASLVRAADYCSKDIWAELTLHNTVGWLPPGERSVWLLDQRINERGVNIDLELVHRAQEIVDRASVPLNREFTKITGLNVGQRDKILAWCEAQGVKLPNMQKGTLAALLGVEDESEDEDITEVSDDDVAGPIELPDTVRRALTIRGITGSASIKKLAAIRACVGADGCARGLLQYHGAGPGRWAGRLIQPQNFPRGSLDRKALGKVGVGLDEIVGAIMTGDPDWVEMVVAHPATAQHPGVYNAIEVVVSSLRNTIIARKGRAIAAGDFSTVELRVNLALAGQEDKIALLASKADPYIDMAQRIYGRKLNKEDNPEERQTGKNSVLGLGFQMGWPKFKAKYGEANTDEFCQEVVRIFREEWAPKIPHNWYELEEAACRTVWDQRPHEAKGVRYQLENGWLSARLPSGRKLWYFNPRPVRKAMPWDPTDVRAAWTYNAMKMGQWRTIDAYGGLLTENVVQALARDLMVAAMFKCENNGLPVILTVHDEIVTEPETRNADVKALEQIMCDRPDWARQMNIPVAAECWVGGRYRK